MKQIILCVCLLLGVLCSCDKKPINGKLDGRWQLMTIEYNDGSIKECERIYCSIQLHLVELIDKGTTPLTLIGHFSSADGVMPQYSGGLFSETGDITITGKDTVVNANGGCADNGITAIAAGAGDIVIESGSVRANGAYGAYTGFTGLSNGLSALKDTDDDTGGNIIISGGNLAATGATDSIYYEGDLIARPSSENIAMSVLDNLIVDEDTGAPDWKAMEQNAAEIAGSPFTEETVLSRTSTEDKLYFSATDGSVYPDDTTDPDGSTGTSGNDNPTGQTGSGTQTGDANNAGDEINAGSSPKTGDEQNIALWILLLAFSGCFITRIYVYNKRKQD